MFVLSCKTGYQLISVVLPWNKCASVSGAQKTDGAEQWWCLTLVACGGDGAGGDGDGGGDGAGAGVGSGDCVGRGGDGAREPTYWLAVHKETDKRTDRQHKISKQARPDQQARLGLAAAAAAAAALTLPLARASR